MLIVPVNKTFLSVDWGKKQFMLIVPVGEMFLSMDGDGGGNYAQSSEVRSGSCSLFLWVKPR